jgi:hypothetical protein
MKQHDIDTLVTEIELNNGIYMRVMFFTLVRFCFDILRCFYRIMHHAVKHTMYHTLCLYLNLLSHLQTSRNVFIC